jgi:UDP-N-acetylmuramoyl-L-alanyl-D-glutamate--2,6-diaminopimelate ligase
MLPHIQTIEQAVQWLRQRGVRRLHTDHRKVAAGDAFLAWPGMRSDGRDHVAAALAQGAAACLLEAGNRPPNESSLISNACASFNQLKLFCGPLASLFYRQPSHQLEIIAVTGTNGKTSSTWWLAQALNQLGKRCAVAGTLGIGEIASQQQAGFSQTGLQGLATGLTTADAVVLQDALQHFVLAGVRACALEASSIGIREHRLDGTLIRVAMFTNFSQDHLDYHQTMQNYWQAKRALFDWPGLTHAVINLDDPQGVLLAQELREKTSIEVITYGQHTAADLKAASVRWVSHLDSATGHSGLKFEVVDQDSRHPVQTAWVGDYNISNLLGVIACLKALGYSIERAVSACQNLASVPGRMQTVNRPGHPLVVVDYAHTPDALGKVLQALQPVAKARGGQLMCVFGCGGDRDRSKRPLMARMAEQSADFLMLTSDNPRTEDPVSIINDIASGLSKQAKHSVCIDRREAIGQMISQAQTADVILIAGKGHENYQEIQGMQLPYSDVEVAEKMLDGGLAP